MMVRFSSRLMGAIAMCVLCVGVASAQIQVPSIAGSGNMLPGVWFENDVRLGGSAAVVDISSVGGNLQSAQPLPDAALQLTTDATNAAKAEVGVLDSYGAAGDILSSLNLAYSYYKTANAHPAPAPSIKLTFYNPVCANPTSAGDCYVALVYEPYYNPANPPVDTWTTVNITPTSGIFWQTGGFGFGNGAGGPPTNTLMGWLSGFPAADDFAGAELVMVSVGVGSYNPDEVGYVDAVSISHTFGGGFSKTYDFEAGPTLSCLGGGFGAPFNKQIALKSKQKRAIPLKMTLLDEDGFVVSDTDLAAPPVVNVTFTPSGGGVSVDATSELVPLGQANEDNVFRYESGSQAWAYNLGSKPFESAGTYLVTAVAGDASYQVDSSCSGTFERLP